MTNVHSTAQKETGTRHWGPHPGYVAVVFTTLFLASLVPVTLIVSETHFPSPLQAPEDVVRYFRNESTRVRVCAFLQFASAIPLGIFTAVMVSRLRFHGARVAGVDIALFGGLAASLFVALSGLVQWTISQPGMSDIPDLTRALHFLIFATGGPGYSVPVGLLLSGISIPALAMRLLPRWLCALGIVLGVIGELSSLSLVIPGALFLIPLTRFPGFLWLIAAGFAMPAARPARNCRVGSRARLEIPLPAAEAAGALPATG
jgi:hypothetical protein